MSPEAMQLWGDEIRETLVYYTRRGATVEEHALCYGLQDILKELDIAAMRGGIPSLGDEYAGSGI